MRGAPRVRWDGPAASSSYSAGLWFGRCYAKLKEHVMRTSPVAVLLGPIRKSDNLAGNHGVLIKRVDRAKPVIAVGDNQLAVRFVPIQ